MELSNLIHWYQKKIGTYDKQQWEKTVEQYILEGFTHVPMRTAKLKTEFIDVDLVRGSSFPKAKPKHGLSTVAFLAIQRLLFLPLHAKWWIQQTSPRIFALFVLLYSLQIFNTCIYFCCDESSDNESDILSGSEVTIPIVMMLVLCMLHSQIVSTNSGPVTLNRQKKTRTGGRSRQVRGRLGKLRSRQHLRVSDDCKSSQDTASEKASTVSGEIPPSVRFAKKVTIDNTIASSSSTATVTAAVTETKPIATVSNETPALAATSYDKESCKEGESSNSLENNSHKIDEVPNVEEVQVLENAEDNDGDNVVPQDDDGFESLNGNVSSDNDKSGMQPDQQIKKTKAKRNETLKNDEERRVWTDTFNDQAPGCVRKKSNYSDSEGDGKNQSIIGSITGRQECESEEEGECEETVVNHLTEATTSATEWMGVTTNSDECSYSSELEESDINNETNFNYNEFVEHPFSWEFELPPSILLSANYTPSDRVSCTIWTRRDIKKAELSVLDISSAIIARVESMPESMDYFYGGLILSLILSLVPSIRRLCDHIGIETISNTTSSPFVTANLTHMNFESYSDTLCKIIDVAFGNTLWERMIVLTSAFERLILSCFLFFLLAVAERTFKQRLLYAKLFSHLTSSRRARKSDLPHFRLNKVRNIKTWLSVRSYLKRRGPQRSVDVIVSAVFIITLLLLSFLCLELIKDIENLHSRYNVEALFWSFALGIFILRFMTLGTKINKKYRNLSVLITEQINLYLQIEQKPHKKEELMVANSVLKLAADLIKELESPFKISGLSANPYLYTIMKVVLLSALSGVFSELLGFKLKLHKIKIK